MSVTKALTIAGSDSGGGAGIQADLKTFQELGVFGMSAITAVTAQNTLGVQGVHPLPVDFVGQQLNSIGNDLTPNAVKTGMLFSAEIIEEVSSQILAFGWKNIVVDPVMIAKGGASLLLDAAVQALKTELLPLAEVVTPNIPEAEVLTGRSIETMEQRQEAAKVLHSLGAKNIVIKGGHGKEELAVDLIFDGECFYELEAKRIHTVHTHGTGCTFSAALAAELAKGASVLDAIHTAKDFITAAIEHTLGIGSGHGPTNHWAYRREKQYV